MRAAALVLVLLVAQGCALSSRTVKTIPVVAGCVAADIATTAQNLNTRPAYPGGPSARELNPALAWAHNDAAAIGVSLAVSGVAQVAAIEWLNRHDHPKLALLVGGSSAASHCGAASWNEYTYQKNRAR